MTSNTFEQITFTGLERPALPTETSIFQAEKKHERVFCPQGYAMQKKIEELKGSDYCFEHCGNYDKYTATTNVARCYWIAKEG